MKKLKLVLLILVLTLATGVLVTYGAESDTSDAGYSQRAVS